MENTDGLPEGLKVPKRYAKTINNRRHFITGAQDALAGRAQPEQEDFACRQGTAAWVAYALGYKAGLNLKTRPQREADPDTESVSPDLGPVAILEV